MNDEQKWSDISNDITNVAKKIKSRIDEEDLVEDLKDTFKEQGNGFGRTYDFKFFPLRIDFILADQSFEVDSFKTFDVEYSDHYPIMTRLSLKDN